MRRPRNRLRRFAKWAGVAACVLFAGAWVASAYGFASIQVGRRAVDVKFGGVWFYGADNSNTNEYRVIRASWLAPHFRHVPLVGSYTGGPAAAPYAIWAIYVPFWCPLVLVAITTVVLWFRDRGYPAGHCLTCGYDLTGNVSGVCPECGTKI